MQFARWTFALVGLAGASPVAAQVYRLDDGVVRVRHGSGSSVPAGQASQRRTAVLADPQPASPVQPVSYQPSWNSAAAAPLLAEAAAQTGLHPALLEALVWQESRWHPGAVSRKGAIGLTQLMPGTARELGVDPRDPSANLMGGARHLRSLIDHFDGDLVKALAAYNAGVRRVEQAGGVPPIPETQQYVLAILGRVTATVNRR